MNSAMTFGRRCRSGSAARVTRCRTLRCSSDARNARTTWRAILGSRLRKRYTLRRRWARSNGRGAACGLEARRGHSNPSARPAAAARPREAPPKPASRASSLRAQRQPSRRGARSGQRCLAGVRMVRNVGLSGTPPMRRLDADAVGRRAAPTVGRSFGQRHIGNGRLRPVTPNDRQRATGIHFMASWSARCRTRSTMPSHCPNSSRNSATNSLRSFSPV